MSKNLSVAVPRHLIGEHYEMPDAPPFSAKDEREHVQKLKNARDELISHLPYNIGQSVRVDVGDDGFVVSEDGAIEGTIVGVIINHPKNGRDNDTYAYVFTYSTEDKGGKEKMKKGNVVEEMPSDMITKEYAKAVAKYENERHHFILLYSFAVHKIANEHYKQCHRGMGYDDLSQEGFIAVSNIADKWAPFLGAKDEGKRILSSINSAIRNEMRRFLDNNNREIKVPSYKIEQVTVRLKADNILYGKRKPQRGNCACDTCTKCENMYGPACRRSKPGKFELGIQQLLKNMYDIKGDKDEQWSRLVDAAQEIDGKSLRDFAIQTGRYKEVAEAANLDVDSIIPMVENTTSIDTPSENGEGTIADMIAHETHDGARSVLAREVLEEAIKHIPTRNGNIIRDHFMHQMSIKEISVKYDFSTVRASGLIKKSVSHLMNNKTSMNIIVHRLISQ